jgi:AcrR family transcriptional regulator
MSRAKYPVAARALLRSTLLDALDHLLRQRAWAQVTMADVAAEAGVSRQTVYNEFGGREGLAQAYVLREAAWFVSAAKDAVAAHPDDPRGAIAAAFDHFLTAALEHPLMRSIAGTDGADDLLALFTTQGEPVLSTASEQLAVFLTQTWARLELSDARLVSDCVVRLAISHAALPGAAPQHTAASVAQLLGPYLDRLLHERANTAVIAV